MPWYLNRSGKRLWYEDEGTGCPVVLLHGWCMSSAVWRYQLAGRGGGGDMAPGPTSVRIVAPDLRGHGRSRAITGNVGFDTLADDLVDLFDALRLTGAVIAGWSMGGQIALQAYAALQDRLAGLVLVSTTPRFIASDDFPFGLGRTEAAGMRLKVQRNLQRALEGFHTRLFEVGECENDIAAAEITRLLAQISLPDSSAAVEALDALVAADMRPLLASIITPTLIMNGEQDRICLPNASWYLQANIAHAVQTVFPRCGHAPFLTRSHKFNAEIIRFAGSVCEQSA
jgi:pimeloyl-[acyl-carrier protein] methyl ester esterase